MLTPLPVAAALCLSYSALAGYQESSSATSIEASQVCEAASRVLRGRESSMALFGVKQSALSALAAIIGDLVSDDEQEPVANATFENARQFVLLIPDDMPMPEFGIDPDGAISLTWWVSRTRVFSVSVSASERLAYAWLDGSNKGHAVDRFRAPSLPARLLSNLQSIIANDTAAIWTA